MPARDPSTLRQDAAAGARVVTAVILACAMAWLTACGGSSSSDGPTLRSGPLAALLEPLALDADRFCILTSPGEEEEGGLDGSVERAGATFHYAGPRPDPLQSNLHVTLDRFGSTAAASRSLDRARRDARRSLGAGARAAGAVPGWPGSAVDGTSFTDYTGAPRSSWSAVGAIGDTVVRIRSFGVPDISTRSEFGAVSRRLRDGFVGRTPGETVPVCAAP